MSRAHTHFRGYRWIIVALLFFATTINYLDRHVLGILAPMLQEEMQWTELQYSGIVIAFQGAYGIGVVLMGGILDRYGARLVYAIGIAVWSLAGMGHAFARSAFGFGLARFSLGLGESINFPAAIKVVAEWFPKKQRALATGLFNGGSNVGAIAAPLLVPWITIRYGWQWAFIFTGAVGFVWLVFWLLFYDKPGRKKGLHPEELAFIWSDQEPETQKLPWSTVIFRRETLTICLARFLSDPTWWFLLYWLPKFLNNKHGITLTDIGLPLITIYVIADIGSIAGGWLSSALIRKGWSIDRARKTTMLICALAVVPVIMAASTDLLWLSVALISLAAAAHCGWMSNMFTVVSDVFPNQAVASVIGVSTLFAVGGGMLISTFVGLILQFTGSYLLVFVMSSSMYLIAWVVLRIGLPEIKSISINQL